MIKRAYNDTRRLAATSFVRRAALIALLWWMLSEGRHDAPLLAVALICAAAASASLCLQPPLRSRWRPLRLPRLALYFLRQSLLGGWDVARRALAPSLPVLPALVRFELRLRAGFPTVLFAWLVSLTPGTAAVAIVGTSLVVHALDVRMSVEEKLRELEAHVASLFDADE